MPSNNDNDDFNALSRVISMLQNLDPGARRRVLQSVLSFFDVEGLALRQSGATGTTYEPPARTKSPPVNYSEDLSISSKEFLLEKQPQTDVERMACLAFYLTHFRNTRYFKTLELSKLNTEAAQPKFSNAATTSNNALKMHYLAPATKGQRQISAAGEQFVRALPDRESAKIAMARYRPRKRKIKRLTRGNTTKNV